jgi:putative DNA primase/helicase
MSARAIAVALGGDVVGPSRILAPGPGHSPSDRSMSVLISPSAPDGFVVSSFTTDDWRACRDHVRGLLGLGDQQPATRILGRRPLASSVADAAARRARHAAELWEESVPLGNTIGEIYLRHRGLAIETDVHDDRSLRFHPRCPFRLITGEILRLPAVVAAMVDIYTNEFRGVHRTAVAANGNGKADATSLGNPKKMLGPAAGACVKLSQDEDVSLGLHIAEGIETALACMAMGFRPMWVALSASGIAKFPVLAGIEALTVFTDHDATGMAAAAECASRWDGAGKDVTRIIPALEGTDFADGQFP